MKAGTVSKLAAVIIMLCAMCLLAACGKAQPKGTPISVEYSINYSGAGENYAVSYSIGLPEGGILGEDGVQLRVKSGYGGGYEYSCVLNSDVLSRAGSVIDENSISDWNGFGKTRPGKDTEKSFSLTVKYLDGSLTEAYGINAFPKNWDKGSQALSNFFDGLLDEESMMAADIPETAQPPETVGQQTIEPSSTAEQFSAAELFSYTLSGDLTAKITAYNGNDSIVAVPDDINGHIVSVIGDNAFYESAVVSVSMGSYITEIGESCFENCRALREIQFPAELSSLPRRAFAGCTALETAALPSMIQVIEPQAFADCVSLSRIKLNEGLISIGSQVFSGCTSLTEINIPYSVMYIAEDAFSGCSGKLRLMVYPDSFGLEYARQHNLDHEEYKIAG